MKSLLRHFRRLVVLSSALTVLIAAPAVAYVAADTVNIGNSVCSGTNFDITGSTDTDCGAKDTGASNTVNHILGLVINIFSLIVGFVAVLMIIIGGIKYITSGGESAETAAAKNTIIYAIVGLVIVVLAQVLVHFVLQKTAVATDTTKCTIAGKTNLAASDPNCKK